MTLDLVVTVILSLLSNIFSVLSPFKETPIRIFLGLVSVLLLPGYSLVSVLFPRSDLDAIERIALSFGLSIAVVPLLGFALIYTPFGIRQVPISIILSTFTISFCIIAWVRRIRLPKQQRFRVSFTAKDFIAGRTMIDKILSVILITSVISACAMFYVMLKPKNTENLTAFYILGPNGKASDYPTNLKLGEEAEVIIGIVNHEYENLTYKLEIRFNGIIIHEEYVSLVKNKTWETPFTFVGTSIGEDQKLEFLLYKGEEVYRTLHLWVDIEA